MSDSTTLLDTISTSQAQKEVTANAMFDSASIAMLFARRATTTTGLTWGFTGGPIFTGGARSYIANGTITLTASTTNYVEADAAGVVTVATSQTAGKMPLYKVVTGASTVTSYEDHRSPVAMAAFFFQYVAAAMADANQTLTQAQALCATIECTGALTAGRNLVAPTARRRFVVFNNTTGGFAVTVKTAAGTGFAVAMGDRATVESDGTNIVLIANSGGSFPVSDAVFGIKGSADATKIAKFEVDGLTTGTTRNFTLPDANITMIGTSGTGAVNAVPYLSAGNVAVADATKLAFDGTTFSLNGDYSQTRIWNNGATTFTAFKQNVTDTASAAGSLLMDLQVGGISKEKTDKSGNKTLAGSLTLDSGVANAIPYLNASKVLTSGSALTFDGSVLLTSRTTDGLIFNARGTGSAQLLLSVIAGDLIYDSSNGNANHIWKRNDVESMRLTDSGLGLGPLGDVFITRDAPNTIAQRNGTAAQESRLYKNFTSAVNYERAFFAAGGGIGGGLWIGWGSAGAGVNRPMEFGVGLQAWQITIANHFTAITDNAYDIGASGANRPRDYFGAGKITSAGATSGIGYATGAGGAVTQITSKSTGVTLNTVTGIITMQAASLAADTTVSFTLTDSAIAATDAVIVLHESAGTLGAYSFASTAAAGSASISVHNNTPGALAEAIVLRFAVIKSVNT